MPNHPFHPTTFSSPRLFLEWNGGRMKGVRLLFAVYCPFPSIFLGVVIQAEDRGEGVLLICIHIYLVLLDERGGFATWSCRSHFDMSLLEMFFSGAEFFTLSISLVVLEKKKLEKNPQRVLIQKRRIVGFAKWDLEENIEMV